MSDPIEDLITRVIEREGGYVNHANDYGGPTKYGITQATLSAWRGQHVRADEVADMGEQEARTIYRSRYFEGLEGIKDPSVLDLLFDYAVNSGSRAMKQGLQRVLKGIGLYKGKIDGDFGPASKAALAAVQEQRQLYFLLVAERLTNYLYIIGNEPSQAVFAEGWANRIMPFWNGVRV